jgi:hypothetical protein
MKNQISITIMVCATIIITLFPGCKTTGLTKEQQLKQFTKMNWLEGYWQNYSPDATLVENWKKVTDTLFLGKSSMIFGGDTLYQEDIKLAPSGKNIYYTVLSHNSENTGRSSYILRKNQAGKLVFEDPGNKEQSRLTYLRKSKDNMVLKVEGLDGSKVTVEVYNLKKINK